MESARSSRPVPESFAWALLLIWWGVLEMFPGLPNGVGALGVGLILLGVNAVRVVNRRAVRRCSVMLGIVALALGALWLAQPVLHLPFALRTSPVALIACGVTILMFEIVSPRRATSVSTTCERNPHEKAS